MNIGIYGDSYACYMDYPYKEQNIRRSWVDIIGDHHSVTNYACSGSNLSYTHDKVLENYKSNDINIVLITHYGRLYLPRLKSKPKYGPGLNYIEYRLSTCDNDHDRIILQAARDFYLYVEDEHETKKFHNLMIEDIRLKVPNAILIPCFHTSMGPKKMPCMFDISVIDNGHYNKDMFALDKKRCHLNDKNNVIFAEKILEHINKNNGSKFIINPSDYVKPHDEPVEYNFIV